MADDEIAAPDSSGDDYDPSEIKKKNDVDGPITLTKRNKFTCFDYTLLILFFGLVLAMLLLKYREETLSKQKEIIQVNIKVYLLSRAIERQLLRTVRNRSRLITRNHQEEV